MTIASFFMKDKEKNSRYFEMTFLFANISIDINLRIFLVLLSNVEINFIG